MMWLRERLHRRAKYGHVSANRLISLAFLGIILAGTLLLLLPISTRSHTSSPFLTALYTATSATCVTGLSLVDTYTHWSLFGHIVILCLIQIGGLGFMAIASSLIFLFRGRVGMKQQLLMAQSLGTPDFQGIVRMQKWMLRMAFLTEGIGAVLLTLRFLPEFGFARSLWLGVFHSVSAFCNAGFDILGFRSAGSSLITYGTDPFILLPVALLVIVGGLGYVVWEEIFTRRSWKKLSVYAKLVCLTTLALLIAGTLLVLVYEYHNPQTLGNLSFPQKLLAAFFQSVTLRTAGFSGIAQRELTEGGKAVSMFLMLVGGSSASTAGGLKTVTLVVILLFLWSRMRGKPTVTVFHRTVPAGLVLNALSIFGLMFSLAFAGAAIICMTSDLTFTEACYETVSAIATVGLSCDASTRVSLIGKLLIILYMYFGRVGVLTISLGFLHPSDTEPRYRYADTQLLIG
ncbi:MAG: potassium uptake protein, TrkH family [Clostridia bacterium]|nr:potassium uptake protein, TrkH family [Clostridia bacterium]